MALMVTNEACFVNKERTSPTRGGTFLTTTLNDETDTCIVFALVWCYACDWTARINVRIASTADRGCAPHAE